MHDQAVTIDAFLTAAAAKAPTPGGGAVAALAGALAASMGEMVLQYSVAKKDLAAHSAFNTEILAELTRARAVLLELMAEDQAVFAELTAAKKSGGDTAKFVEACIAVPQAIGATAMAILDLAVRVAATSNKYLASDLAVCGDLAMAAVRASVHNVRANLPEVDAARDAQLNNECEQLLKRGVASVQKLTAAITAAKGAA
ncbi:MAG: Formimidoyltetrahydrofolate cyclodeaminase [Phycisphaerales bacterium]|nr:Formimidoyltetrahydrofolate cyclodeaminase [Phycisphaerales bacterium]